MNKTQINYAKARLEIIARKHKEKIDEEIKPAIVEPSWEEKVSLILSGKASIKTEKLAEAIAQDHCSYELKHCLKFFTFGDEVQIETEVEKCRLLRKKKIEEVNEVLQDYLDKIVLDGKTEARMLKAFSERNFIK